MGINENYRDKGVGIAIYGELKSNPSVQSSGLSCNLSEEELSGRISLKQKKRKGKKHVRGTEESCNSEFIHKCEP